MVDTPPVNPQFDTLAPQALVITEVGGTIKKKLSCPSSPGENTVLRANKPQKSGIRACRDYRVIGTCLAPAQGSATITSLYVAKFGAPLVGTRVVVQASMMVDGFEHRTSNAVPR
jgi:hypothetical protein